MTEQESNNGQTDEATPPLTPEEYERIGRQQRSLKNLIINPKMQWTLLGYFAMISVQIVGFLFYSSYQKSKDLDIIINGLALPSNHAIHDYLQN